jgi:YD repeat-containing protein
MDALRPFQTRFLGRALAPGIDTAALSLPRGNGKSWLAGYLAARVLTPGDELFQPGTESVLGAGSLEQARIVYKFVRDELGEDTGYRYLDSGQRIAVTHAASNTKLRVISSSGKTAMGLVGCPLAILDEPGSWETAGGQLMFDAIQTAMGKPNSPLKAIYIGTIAPSDRGWWPELVERGSHGSTYVQKLVGDPEKWDRWSEIKRCNPLVAISPEFRKKLKEERDEARKDSRLKARFLSYRLNCPTQDESTVLLTTEDWKLMLTRPVPERKGSPIVGIDLGGGRAWSSAVAVWRNGRTEAIGLKQTPYIATKERANPADIQEGH